MEPVGDLPLQIDSHLHGTGRDDVDYLTQEEAEEIHQQFRNFNFKAGSQVMWSGVPREWAQQWADEHAMQTLTSAMGPLMSTGNSSCRKSSKNRRQWKKYIKGASAIFAMYVPKGDSVTVLSRPPPYRLNPEGKSTYQSIEEPILKGFGGGSSVSRIDMVHLTAVGAEHVRYQSWPVDEVEQWVKIFGKSLARKKYGQNHQCPLKACQNLSAMEKETMRSEVGREQEMAEDQKMSEVLAATEEKKAIKKQEVKRMAAAKQKAAQEAARMRKVAKQLEEVERQAAAKKQKAIQKAAKTQEAAKNQETERLAAAERKAERVAVAKKQEAEKVAAAMEQKAIKKAAKKQEADKRQAAEKLAAAKKREAIKKAAEKQEAVRKQEAERLVEAKKRKVIETQEMVKKQKVEKLAAAERQRAIKKQEATKKKDAKEPADTKKKAIKKAAIKHTGPTSEMTYGAGLLSRSYLKFL